MEDNDIVESMKPWLEEEEKSGLEEVEKPELEVVKMPEFETAKRKSKGDHEKESKEDNVSGNWPQNVSRFVSAKSMNCRCRPSAVRRVLDKVRPIIQEETWHRLEAMNLVQFFELPSYPQDHVLTMHILNCWDIDRTIFNLGGKEIEFDADQVALLIGMPNRGPPALWNKSPPCSVYARQIKDEFENVSPGESSDRFVALFIKFLMTNLIFPSSNFRVSQGLYSLCEDIHAFSSYNWPATICYFLTEQLNESAMKIRREQPLGYINGFVFLLTLWFYEHTSLVLPVVPDARPRMLRWPVNVSWNSLQIELSFNRLNPSQVYDHFLDLKDCEHALLAPLPIEEPCCTPKHLPQQETQSSPLSPSLFEISNIVPYNTCPQPTHVQTKTHTPCQIGLEEIYQLLLDFQNSVNARLTTLDNTLSELKFKISELEKTLKQPRGESVKTWIKESPRASLIQRIKTKGSRRKRQISSPFIVFERKIRKKIIEKMVEEVDKVEGDKSIPHQNQQQEVEDDEKEEEPIPQQPIQYDIISDLGTIHITQQTNVQETLSYEEEAQDVHKEEDTLESDKLLVTDDYPDEVCPAPLVLDFPAREQIPDYMRETIDMCCSKFTDYGNFLINMGHVTLTRRYFDELLTNGWLGNEQVDSFAMLLENKRCKEPQMYRSYVYVSPLHWLYRHLNVRNFVNHITKESMENVDLVMIPIINNRHWTLLVGALTEHKWRLYDSLRNGIHLGITHDIIKYFVKHAGEAFKTDLAKWEVVMAKGIPTQSNGFDCGVFVCKYMEALVQKNSGKWEDKLEWQDSMPLFRAQIGYEICKFALSQTNSSNIEAIEVRNEI